MNVIFRTRVSIPIRVFFGFLIGLGLFVVAESAFGANRPQNGRNPSGAEGVRQTHTPAEVAEEPSEEAGGDSHFVYRSNPDRDVWFFNTRSASPTAPSEQQFQRIKVRRFMQMPTPSRHHWTDASMDEFWETYDSSIPLIVLVHGNYTTGPQSIQSGNMLENKFFPKTERFAGAKYRLVIWSWPADEVYKRYLPDAKLKGYYSEKQGEYLAQFLSRLPSGSRVSLIGFSFGARTTCEAVQRISFNPQFYTESPEGTKTPNLQIRNLLLSPAVDQVSLAPRFRYGNVVSVSQQSIVLFNPKDIALRFYPKLVGCGGPQALGRDGIPFSLLPSGLRNKISGINIYSLADTRHSFVVFFRNPELNRKLGDYLLFEN